MKAVFYDRDGVLTHLVDRDGLLTAPWTLDEFRLIDGSYNTTQLTHDLGFTNIIISNQPDLLDGKITNYDFDMFDRIILDRLVIDIIAYAQKRNTEYYKPQSGLIQLLIDSYQIDISSSYLIGDRWKDIVAANALGLQTIYIGDKYICPPEYNQIKPNWIVQDTFSAGYLIKKLEEHHD